MKNHPKTLPKSLKNQGKIDKKSKKMNEKSQQDLRCAKHAKKYEKLRKNAKNEPNIAPKGDAPFWVAVSAYPCLAY